MAAALLSRYLMSAERVSKDRMQTREDPSTAALSFTGPLFIVGIGRSGTKLLRDLLRGHSLIRIPPTESSMLPRWVEEWDRYGDLSDRAAFSAFYRRAVRTKYSLLMEKHTGGPISEEDWFATCRGYGPADVFEALIRHDVGAPVGTALIWGDKSPNYTLHIPLLAELFPEARFIHIVRDVRDCTLSAKKSWGGNMLRGAQRWADGTMKARRDGESLPGRYIEVRYEDLLAEPERQLRRCCDLLGIEFEPEMMRLRYSTEHVGAGRGQDTILSTNVRKFERSMDPRMREQIESVAADAMRAFGYDTQQSGPVRRVGRIKMAFYRLLDALHFVVARARRWGLKRTVQIRLARLVRG
jgi:sulfotransferase family protein